MGIIPFESERAKLLRKAAALIRDGWVTGHLCVLGETGQPQYCIMGAALKAKGWNGTHEGDAMSDESLYHTAYDLLGFTPVIDIYDELENEDDSPYNWNDSFLLGDSGSQVADKLEYMADNNMTWDDFIAEERAKEE